MNKKIKRIIYALILIIPITTVYFIGQSSVSNYKEALQQHEVKSKDCKDRLKQHAQNMKDKEIQTHSDAKREKAKKWLDSMMLVFSEKYEASQVNVKRELQETIDIAYKNSHAAAKKYKNQKKYTTAIRRAIKLELSKIKSDNGIFLVDYTGNTLFGANSKEDINARTILLEEIQKVRRRGGGYIVSDVDYEGTKRHIIVKDLGINKLFIGADLYANDKNTQLKKSLLDIVKITLLEENECLSLREKDKLIYQSAQCENFQDKAGKYDAHFKDLDWTLEFSFDSTKKEEVETQKLKGFEKLLKINE